MPETQGQRGAAGRKGTARQRDAEEATLHEHGGAIDRATELSDEVLQRLESGQRAAIDAVRTFVETVDEVLPALGERPSRRQKVIDAAMEMTDRLVHTQYEFLRQVVQSTGDALSRPDDEKK